MDLTVYRQASKIRPDGTVVYKGEDALPYVDGQLMIIADGLGGAASIRHSSVRPELFDENTVADTLFKDVWEDCSDKRLADYVKKSFFELYSVKNCYTANVNNIKKSGYFASRFVSAIVLHELIHNNAVNPEVFFGALDKEKNESKKAAALKKLGDYFTGKIAGDLKKIAANANIFYESSYSGLSLLGTTLCAAIYREREQEADVIYLTAGDSRPYYWSVNDGLCQLVGDEERADGGMTNYIKVSDNTEFKIRCTYKKLKKPCMIFNASDGCFDSGKFATPLAFELTVLKAAADSESTEEMSRHLTDFFAEYGRHDDSSTIAANFFGYKDFADFKNAAVCRIEAVKREYLANLPDLLETDYIGEYEKSAASAKEKIHSLCEGLKGTKAVSDYCRQCVSDEAVTRAAALDNVKAAAEKSETACNKISDLITDRLAEFILSCPDNCGFDRKTAERIMTVEESRRAVCKTYSAKLESCRTSLPEAAAKLEKVITELEKTGLPENFSDFGDVDFTDITECRIIIEELFGFISGIRCGKNEAVKTIMAKKKEYTEQNRALARQNPEALRMLSLLLAGGRIAIPAEIQGEEKSGLDSAVMAAQIAETEYNKLRREAEERLIHESAEKLWTERAENIIAEVVADSSKFPRELADTITGAVRSINEETANIQTKAELQQRLFDKFDKKYRSLMGVDK